MVRRILVCTVLILMAALTAIGQNMQSLYFLDNSIYGYRINPAIPSETNFAGQVVNNVDLSAGSSLGLANFFFKDSGGRLVSGFNRSLPSETFLGTLPESNDVAAVENLSVVSCGFWTEKDFFHNVEINVRGYENASVPKEMFALLKDGNRAEPYDLSGFRLSAQAYLEIAYGLSKSINDKITVGGRFKFLSGIMNLFAETGHTKVMMNGQNVTSNSDMVFRSASNMLEIPTRPSVQSSGRRVLDFSKTAPSGNVFKPAGFGAVVDLGATYRVLDNLTLSLSVLDLGAVRWKQNITGKSSGNNVSQSGNLMNMSEMKTIGDKIGGSLTNLGNIVEVEAAPAAGDSFSTEMLPVTINAGARYRMPFYDRLSAGVLGSFRTGRGTEYSEFRAGVSVTPLDQLSLNVNYGFSSYGRTFGTAMNFNLAFFHIHLGYEGYSGPVARFRNDCRTYNLPLGKYRYNVNLGLTIAFGERHRNYDPMQ